MLDEAGLWARELLTSSDMPERQMTQDVYIGRKVVDARVAEALEDAPGTTTPGEGPAKKSE